ncbi:1-deoxy-D-xylulose-5-phosphate synthase [Anaerobranca gottschalkii]|uniref:1-deoxy-D-xylulose-5-phosphate synthase n=1 Tax=Anaerobranca gottschalkii DSM 13577 TaxID=1120990 RepID=A0A1H9Y234_9FIRM|nr:1-deoxy-D-xylulose-5-phosphate synthase [Anaerobranca gottschalkii]SES62773.1 1-deoxy-D-xylulose-5-phosphate synthase [Anaerobranca gottschalkii DSM 13577]
MNYPILSKINSPDDIKTLNGEEISKLCEEIREFLIENVSKTGGHLAPNLGVVELTIALHRVFNSPIDKIVWDVGHQTYVHKIITGRRDNFHTLRKYGGLSGFPKCKESVHDHFETGHSSTSISAALGMALAREIKGENYNVVAVIGDGAMTGGMAFEALNFAGHKQDCKLIVVLNDNEMSITNNVGGLSSYLNRLRTDSKYTKIKKDIQYILNKVPAIGGKLYKSLERVKDSLKYLLVAGILFEELGFKYLGPIDGHNFNVVEDTLRKAKKVDGPVLVHVITKKGKGYWPAEDNPQLFHGVGQFEKETGRVIEGKGISFTEVFSKSIIEQAEKNPNIIAITAAMAPGTGLDEFAQKYPQRFFDVGIAEQNAVTMAAGLAKEGMKPIFAVYSTFLQRGYDQVLHDVCLPNLPVIFAIDRAGIVGADGETHQGIYDIAFLRHIPNITIISPKDGQELRDGIHTALTLKTPVAIRYPKDIVVEEFIDYNNPRILENKGQVLKQGEEVLLISTGVTSNISLEGAKKLLDVGINATVVHFPYIKPFDKDTLITLAQKHRLALVIEDHTKIGGFGELVSSIFIEENVHCKLLSISLPDKFIEHGSRKKILDKYGISAEGIYKKIIGEISGVGYGKESAIRPVIG